MLRIREVSDANVFPDSQTGLGPVENIGEPGIRFSMSICPSRCSESSHICKSYCFRMIITESVYRVVVDRRVGPEYVWITESCKEGGLKCVRAFRCVQHFGAFAELHDSLILTFEVVHQARRRVREFRICAPERSNDARIPYSLDFVSVVVTCGISISNSLEASVRMAVHTGTKHASQTSAALCRKDNDVHVSVEGGSMHGNDLHMLYQWSDMRVGIRRRTFCTSVGSLQGWRVTCGAD